MSGRASHEVLHVLAGPTAVGKTAAALDWARRHDGVIVSADAIQAYRGLDIGTAKPTAEERLGVRHVGLDFLDPGDRGSVDLWIAEVAPRLAEFREQGVPVLVTGGSGFYLKACFGPITDGIEVSPAIRDEVATLEREGGLGALKARLASLHRDPKQSLAGIDLANPRRVASALARCLASGLEVPALRERFLALPGPFGNRPVHAVLLTRSREDLATRIEARTRAMLATGLVDEVRRHEAALRSNPTAGTAIGYRETLAFLAGGPDAPGTIEELATTIAANTRALVRRQETWFRHQIRFDRIIHLAPHAEARLA